MKHFADMLFNLVFLPVIDKPSCISTQTTTLIYNIITNILHISQESGLLLADIIYHLPVYCVSNNNFTPQQE